MIHHARCDAPAHRGEQSGAGGLVMEFYTRMAKMFAQFAGSELFEKRRGVGSMGFDPECGGTVVAYFNNNPYAANKAARPSEADRIIRRLQDAGHKVLARALCDDSYTEVLLVSVKFQEGVCPHDVVSSIVDEETARTFEGLTSNA
jgi:hypothetical protein